MPSILQYKYKIPKYLRLHDVQRILGQIKTSRDILLHGLGEPLLNPEFVDIVRFLKERDKPAILSHVVDIEIIPDQ